MKTGKPCEVCTRVRRPEDCENKTCKEWQQWFIERWDAMRSSVLQSDAGESRMGDTIRVGGTEYHHPDQTRRFLAVNPCHKCIRAATLCAGACDTKKAWIAAKERINELETGSEREIKKI